MTFSPHASLFWEDFDSPVEASAADALSDDVLAQQAEMEQAQQKEAACAAARQAGFEEGVRFGREHAAAEHALQRNAFERSIQACLAAVQAEVQEHLRAAADQASMMLLEMVSRLFPALLDGYGAQERALVLEKILPLLQNIANVECTVPVGEAEDVRMLCQQQGVDFVRYTENESLASGDFQVRWGEGKAVRDAQGIMQALQQILTSQTQTTKG